MIRLIQITKADNKISCLAYVEDCETPIKLVYDIDKDEMQPYQLPNGYEYCTTHIRMAATYFRDKIAGEGYPKERLIMWY